MLQIKDNFRVNICLLFISAIGSLAVGYFVYSHLAKNSHQNIRPTEGGPWDYTFFNQKGRKISEREGRLKLVMDPFTIYKNYPNQQYPNFAINKHGFREGHTSDKAYTAVVLGGSAAFGYVLDNDRKTFSSILSFANEKYNVINSSVIGFMSGQELAQMIHYLDDIDPALYIVFDGWNDLDIPYDAVKTWPVTNAPIGYNPTFTMIEDRLAEYFRMTRKNKEQPEVRADLVEETLDEKNFFPEILKRYTSNIGKMYDFAHTRGSEFLLVFQPELGNKKFLSGYEKESLQSWDSKFGYLERKIPERYKQFIREAKKIFQEKNIPFIDINDEPEFGENPETLFFDPVHPNELGHKIIASILGQALSKGLKNL